MGFHAVRFDGVTPASPAALFGARSTRRSYGRAAVAAAIENGMLPGELSEVLAGRSVVEAFPVAGHESVSDYAERAVAELMVAYLSHPLV